MELRGSPTSSHSTCIGMSTALSSTARYCTTLSCTALSCALPLSPGPSGVDLPAGLSRRLLESLLGELHLVAAKHSTQCSMLNAAAATVSGMNRSKHRQLFTHRCTTYSGKGPTSGQRFRPNPGLKKITQVHMKKQHEPIVVKKGDALEKHAAPFKGP